MKVPPFLLAQVAEECGTLPVGRGGMDDVELRLQAMIDIVIVFDGIPEMKDDWFQSGHGVRHDSTQEQEQEQEQEHAEAVAAAAAAAAARSGAGSQAFFWVSAPSTGRVSGSVGGWLQRVVRRPAAWFCMRGTIVRTGAAN